MSNFTRVFLYKVLISFNAAVSDFMAYLDEWHVIC